MSAIFSGRRSSELREDFGCRLRIEETLARIDCTVGPLCVRRYPAASDVSSVGRSGLGVDSQTNHTVHQMEELFYAVFSLVSLACLNTLGAVLEMVLEVDALLGLGAFYEAIQMFDQYCASCRA